MECGGRVRRECALTAPPRMNTMPGTLITPFSPPTCTFAVEMNLMNPTRGPNMSRDCTWTFSMKSFGSALILTNQSLKTCASSTFVRSMPGSAVTGTATASPESPSICTVASAIVRERQDSARARSQLQVALLLGDRLDDDTSMCP